MEYIIYVRKSTDENSEHQKQSIPDQIVKCIEFAKNNGLIIASKPNDFSGFETEKDIKLEHNEKDEINREIYKKYSSFFIVRERESSKEPYKRPKWRKIIEWIKQGKIKGILSYSPDRQARNLLEAGELIDLVDRGLVDLKYTNFHFEPNASGKMMLGIWFVFSKQYSDKLSEDITRGNLSKLEKGYALGKYKWGYKINEEGFHEPDGYNFILLKKAFHLKIYEGKTNSYIVKWLNNEGFYRLGKKGKKFYITERSIQDVFRDTFYYGLFKHSGLKIDLTKVNKFFIPIISKEEFIILQSTITPKKEINKSESIYKNIKPFSDNFVITEDGYTCSFYIAKSKYWKKKLQTNNLSDFKELQIPYSYYIYSVSKKSKVKNFIKQIKVSDIIEIFTESLLNFNFPKCLLNNLIKEGKTYIDTVIKNRNKKENLIKKNLNELNSKLKKIVLNTETLNLSAIEQQILEKEKRETIKKIISLKSELGNNVDNNRNYFKEYRIFLNLWFYLTKHKSNILKVRDSKFLEIFVSNIIITSKGPKLSVFQEIQQIYTRLVDLTGIEPVYRHEAV